MKRLLSNVLVTGGAGFIGSNFIHFLFNQPSFKGNIINVDAVTYAGNLQNLLSIEVEFGTKQRYFFEKVDICEYDKILSILKKYDIDTIVNFAAETHVDRSILGPKSFISTNVVGTFTLLEAARSFWTEINSTNLRNDVLFHHISTDEVYGSLGETGSFLETTAYDPHSPYSASKASSDFIANAYFHTYGLPVTISNCSNNYGPYQFPEKFIPVMILNILEDKDLPVYGNGKNIRDWIYVEDHCEAIWSILIHGKVGEKYNVGGECELENITLLDKIINVISDELDLDSKNIKKNIQYVKDRPGHDYRYSIDCSKIKKELNWHHSTNIDDGIRKTVRWYISHREWIENIKTGEYKQWFEKNYVKREKGL